jgi:hypothetical protein
MNAKERAELYMSLKKGYKRSKKEQIKEYHNSLMLGNKLEWLFKVTGIKWLVKKINPNCNCEYRKNKLNNFEFKRK